VDQVGQTLGQVALGADRPAQLLGRPTRVCGSSARALIATRLHKEEKPESVEATPLSRPARWLGRPITTWCQTDLSKLVEVPFTPINTPLVVKVDTHHTHFVFLHM
jgi:hypothetical protein